MELVPYNSTLDDGNSDNTWMMGYQCTGSTTSIPSIPLPFDLRGYDSVAVAAAAAAALIAPTADMTFPGQITSQD